MFGDNISARFDLNATYYKCADYNQTEWLISVDNSAQPLSVFGVKLSNFQLRVKGTKQLASTNSTTNSTYWSGVISGTLDFGGDASLIAIGSLTFDSVHGVSSLQTATTFSSTYVDVTFNLNYYASVDCTSAAPFDASNSTTYSGSSGSGIVTIKSIMLY